MRFAPSGPPERIVLRSEIQATPLWTLQVRGNDGHSASLCSQSASLYVSDGWGVARALRRLDLATGAERARRAIGAELRCAQLMPGGRRVLVASARKLYLLNAETLTEEGRWDRWIPRYTATMARQDRYVVMANWLTPTASILDLESGQIRRRRLGPQMTLLSAPEHPLGVCKRSGGTFVTDPEVATVAKLADTPPCHQAALSLDGRLLWLVAGVQVNIQRQEETMTISPGPASRLLEEYALDGAARPRAWELPAAIRIIVAGRSELWGTPAPLHREPQHVLILTRPVGSADAVQ